MVAGQVVAVTGASGKTGLAVTAAYANAGWQVRALFRPRRGARAPSGVDHRPDVQWIPGDLRQRADLVQLFRGCDAVYLIVPNMAPDEPDLAAAVLGAMRVAGVDRVVYHSVLHPGIEAMPHHFNKLRAESRLLTAPVAPTFLQPAPYLQNFVPYIERARRGERVTFPYRAQTLLSMVDLHDIAEVAVRATAAEHTGGAYQLCSGQLLTQQQAWERVCGLLQLSAPFVPQSAADWRRTAGAALDTRAADWLEAMFAHYDRHGLRGSALPLRTLLGREPTSLEEWLRRSFRTDTPAHGGR